jgi:hypothetical protein
MPSRMTRRESLAAASALALGSVASSRVLAAPPDAAPREKKPVAAIVTSYYNVSHADVIVTKILEGWQRDGGPGPDLRLASLYMDQVSPHDIGKDLAARHQVRLCKSIDDALTFGTDELQVAGVLLIGEHGDYPHTSDTHQHMYPRRRFFEETVAAFERCGQTAPVFNDKHLSYRWDDARWMVDKAQEMKFPFLAGSSLPLTRRAPLLELPLDCELDEALAIGYGPLESYGFHALETLQCMIERRRGGETGAASVQAVRGDAIRAAQKEGLWSGDLFAAALATFPGDRRDNGEWVHNEMSAAYLVPRRDGLRTSVLMADGLSPGFAFAARLKGQREPVATWFQLQDGGCFPHFAYLLQAFEATVHAGRAVYPVERTLLTTGILDRAMHSLAQDGERLATPELQIAYRGADWPFANHPRATLQVPIE